MSKNETNLCITRFLDWFGMLSVQIWQKSLSSNALLQKPRFFDPACISYSTLLGLFSSLQGSINPVFLDETNDSPTKFYNIYSTVADEEVTLLGNTPTQKLGRSISIFIERGFTRSCFPKSNKKLVRGLVALHVTLDYFFRGKSIVRHVNVYSSGYMRHLATF